MGGGLVGSVVAMLVKAADVDKGEVTKGCVCWEWMGQADPRTSAASLSHGCEG